MSGAGSDRAGTDVRRSADPRLQWLAPVAGCVVLVASSVLVSMRKYFWNDELYSHYLLADESFAGMLAAFHDAINNSPPLYFLTGWVWARIFGADELSLRLFSTLGVCAALCLLWLALRRVYGHWPATLGVLAVFGTSQLILSQNAEARMYGLYLALCAAAVLLHERARADAPPVRTLTLLFCVHAGIVLTHLLGPLFSAGFLAALVVADRRTGRFRPRLYLPIVAAWLTFLPYLPSFLVQAEAGRPRSWLPTPTVSDLVDFMTLSDATLLRPAALALVLIVAAAFPLARRFTRQRDGGRAARGAPGSAARHVDPLQPAAVHMLILALALVALPVVAWVVSVGVRPVFQDRYLIPATLGWAMLLSHVIAFAARRGPRLVLVPAAASLALLAQPLRFASQYPTGIRPGTTDTLFGHSGLPVVVQSSHRFLERIHYAPDPGRYRFVLDLETALADASGPFGPQEYRHLEALLRNYPERFAGRIIDSATFLAANDRFLVVDVPRFDRECPPRVKGLRRWDDIHCPQWLERRILDDPRYVATILGGTDGITVLLVTRDPTGDSTPRSRPD